MTDIKSRLRDPDFAGPMQHLRDWQEIDALMSEAAADIERLEAALEPFVKAFESRRDAHSKRYRDRDLGYANFDKMPDAWPMEAITFKMGAFRRARNTLKGGEDDQGR